jgi:hypothetical protein
MCTILSNNACIEEEIIAAFQKIVDGPIGATAFKVRRRGLLE